MITQRSVKRQYILLRHAYPLCHCERSVAIPSPSQRRFADVGSISSRLPRRYAPRNDRLKRVRVGDTPLMRTHFVIASAAWQSRLRRNGGSPTWVQPRRDCRAAMLLAMTDYSVYTWAIRTLRAQSTHATLSGHGRDLAWEFYPYEPDRFLRRKKCPCGCRGIAATGVARANFTHAPGPGMPLPNVGNQAGATLGYGATSSKRLLTPQVTKSRFAGRRFGH